MFFQRKKNQKLQKYDDEIIDKLDFLSKYGSALHYSGISAPNLEAALRNLASSLDLEIQTFSSPTVLIISLNKDHQFKTVSKTLEPSSANLSRLRMLDNLGDALSSGEINLEQAQSRIEEINNSKSEKAWYLVLMAYAVTSASIMLLLSGTLLEFSICACLGTLAGLIDLGCSKIERLKRFHEFFSTAIITAAVYSIHNWLPNFNLLTVIIASTIIMIPGLSLTISLTELACNHLLSGTSRLMAAIIVFFKMVFGYLVGSRLVMFFIGTKTIEYQHEALPEYLSWIALSILPLTMAVIFKANFKDAPVMFISIVLGFAVTKYSGAYFDNQFLGAFLGAFAVGLSASISARLFHKPVATQLMPGILLLVPGSIGFKGLSYILEHETLAGIDATFETFIIAISIVAGLLLSNILYSPKRSL